MQADIDYDNLPDYLDYDIDITAGGLEEIASQEAFREVYGAPLEVNEGKTNDITSIPPNVDFKDANDDRICGGIVEYEL